MFGAAYYRYRLRKVGPERPESTVGENCATAVNAKDRDIRILAYRTVQNISAGPVDKQTRNALRAECLPEYTDTWTESPIRNAAYPSCKTSSGVCLPNNTAAAAAVRRVISEHAHAIRTKGHSIYASDVAAACTG